MKKRYRIRNWNEYNKSLKERGSITVWFSEDAIKSWHNPPHNHRSGRPREYSNEAILTFLILREVYKLPLRAAEGFLCSLVMLLQLKIRIPSYSQVCRRARELGKEIERISKKKVTDLVIDSTGLKVYGEGEWKVRQHGVGKRRSWRKIHLGVDPDSHEIIVAEMTEKEAGDGETGKELLKRVPKGLKRVFGDGGYDGTPFRSAVLEAGAEAIIPPPVNAVVKKRSKGARKLRDDSLKEIEGLGGGEEGRRLWKILTRYHTRSLAETAMFRFKQLLGDRLKSRMWENQRSEVMVKCLIINRITGLGMPRGEWLEAA